MDNEDHLGLQVCLVLKDREDSQVQEVHGVNVVPEEEWACKDPL